MAIEIAGVYEVDGAPDVSLVEVIDNEARPSELHLGGFTQEEAGQPRSNWQSPYMEQYLDAVGERRLSEPFDLPDEDEPPTRVAFFLHFLDTSRPLITPQGDLPLPPRSSMPQRLRGEIEYEPVD
jgi:hypothetical protein